MKRVEATVSLPKTARELAVGYDRRNSKPYWTVRKE